MAPNANKKYIQTALRAVPLVAFPLEFAMSLPYAIAMHKVAPAFGLIPLAASFAQSWWLLSVSGWFRETFCMGGDNYHYHILRDDEPPKKPQPRLVVVAIADLFLGLLSTLMIVSTIIEMTSSWSGWGSDHDDILGTYCTLPYLATVTAHAILLLMGLHNITKESRKALTRCPHCQKSLFGTPDSSVPASVTPVARQSSPPVNPVPDPNVLDV